MNLRDDIQRNVERKLPWLLGERWQNRPVPQRWGLGVFAVTILVLGAGLLFLMFPQLLTQPGTAFPELYRKASYVLLIGLDFGLKAYILARRARSSPLLPILIPFILSHIFFRIPVIGVLLPYAVLRYVGTARKAGVQRGSEVVNAKSLQHYLVKREARLLAKNPKLSQHDPQFEIGGVRLPNYLESLGFFFTGSPGSGKSQAIKKMLHTMKGRPDFRAIILDRNGELLESFYEEGVDLIFNPSDARSVGWDHRYENASSESIAAALIPDDPKDRFFSEAAKSLLADLYERCDNNAEIWEVLSEFSMEELGDFLRGGVSARYFQAERTGASVISTLVNQMRFYKGLPDGDFSFSQWGREDDPRWLFVPIFEDEAEKFKPLYSMGFDMMLRGLLSNENRSLKTAIVIDELGALNQLTSLPRLLAEARKFGGTAMLGTQTTAQIQRVYGAENSRIILQGTATKLILNCRDGQTAEEMAGVIGKQERLDINYSHGSKLLSETRSSEQIRETYAVMPSELQALEPLTGYLNISDGSPPAKVQVSPRSYARKANRLVPRNRPHSGGLPKTSRHPVPEHGGSDRQDRQVRQSKGRQPADRLHPQRSSHGHR